MDWLDAVILGLVQGLTEFLPVSSSAHLRFVGSLIGNSDPGAAFTAITQLGTETAVLIFFWKDIVRILKSWWMAMPWISSDRRVPQSNPDTRMGWMIIMGSIPIGVLGLLFEGWIDTTLRNLWITVFVMAGFGLLLGWADRIGKSTKTLDQLSWRDAVGYGFAQALALIPGVSRSGGTITAGRLMGYEREAAARYSFLLALPAVFISGLYKVYKVASGGDAVVVGPTILATVVAFVVGYLVIVWFLNLISTHSFMPFVYYRLAFAAVVAVCLLTGLVPAVGGAGA